MNFTRNKASIFQVVTTDFIIQLIAIFIMILPPVYFSLRLDPQPKFNSITFFFTFAAMLVVVGVVRALWELRRIKQIFEHGIEIVGTVTALTTYKYTSITFSYTYLQHIYSMVESIGATERTDPLKIGSQVILIVDVTNPRRALIRDLYVSEDDFGRNRTEFERLSTNTADT